MGDEHTARWLVESQGHIDPTIHNRGTTATLHSTPFLRFYFWKGVYFHSSRVLRGSYLLSHWCVHSVDSFLIQVE